MTNVDIPRGYTLGFLDVFCMEWDEKEGVVSTSLVGILSMFQCKKYLSSIKTVAQSNLILYKSGLFAKSSLDTFSFLHALVCFLDFRNVTVRLK